MSDRDYTDLSRDDVAVYNFRGYTVLRFFKVGPRAKQLVIGDNANECHFIPEDYKLMGKFLLECFQFCEGKVADVKHVRV